VLSLHTLADLELGLPAEGPHASASMTLRDALALLIVERADVIAVTDAEGTVIGSVTKDDLLR
jgi:CBS domain containing-hemolysin-like protein